MARRRPPLSIQSVVVPKSEGTKAQATAKAKRVTGKTPRTSRTTTGSYRFAQFSPKQCVAGTVRSKEIPGATLVLCRKRGRAAAGR